MLQGGTSGLKTAESVRAVRTGAPFPECTYILLINGCKGGK